MRIKTIVSITLAFLFTSFAYGQNAAAPSSTAAEAKPKTELQAFQEKFGTVIVQGYTKTASISGLGGSLQIIVKEFKNATANTKMKGLVIEVDSTERYASNARTFIDYSEIDSLIKGIEYISKIDKAVTTLNNFEAQYKTKDDFAITLFNREGTDTLNVGLSVGSIGRKSIFVVPGKLAELLTGLQQAKAALDAL